MSKETNLVDLLARMWIECDPNRGGGGCNPDDLDAKHRPRWEWFIPRAEASIKYLEDAGYSVTRMVTTTTEQGARP